MKHFHIWPIAETRAIKISMQSIQKKETKKESKRMDHSVHPASSVVRSFSYPAFYFAPFIPILRKYAHSEMVEHSLIMLIGDG